MNLCNLKSSTYRNKIYIMIFLIFSSSIAIISLLFLWFSFNETTKEENKNVVRAYLRTTEKPKFLTISISRNDAEKKFGEVRKFDLNIKDISACRGMLEGFRGNSAYIKESSSMYYLDNIIRNGTNSFCLNQKYPFNVKIISE